VLLPQREGIQRRHTKAAALLCFVCDEMGKSKIFSLKRARRAHNKHAPNAAVSDGTGGRVFTTADGKWTISYLPVAQLATITSTRWQLLSVYAQ